MQKSACPPVWSKNSEVAPNPKQAYFWTRDSFRLFFVGLCTVGKNSNTTPLEKRISELGASRRDCGLIRRRSLWLISLVYSSKTNINAKKKKTKSNRVKAVPYRNRPQEKRYVVHAFAPPPQKKEKNKGVLRSFLCEPRIWFEEFGVLHPFTE